jgi:DNA primase large subunit
MLETPRLALPHPLNWRAKMDEANQAYHRKVAIAIIAMAMFEARKEIKRNIQREGRVKLSRVPHREIERMAKAMVMERRDEFIAKAKASSVVQDEIQRLQAKEERKRQRTLERNSQDLHKLGSAEPQALPLCEIHDRNGATR